MPGGCATVKWDAEAIEPKSATLIEGGVLNDYQTNREQAAWLAPYYHAVGRPVRSHGYAASASALTIPAQQRPNLIITPAKTEVTMVDMIRDVKNGVAIVDGNNGRIGVTTDWQARMGQIGPSNSNPCMREIVNGKLGTFLGGDAMLSFSAPTLWKNLAALGGPASVGTWGLSDTKGQPAQTTFHSVRAVPALFRRVVLMDSSRGL
jgi:predicted Zn-dependent protease